MEFEKRPHEPDFGRLRKALLLEGEPDWVPLVELDVEKEVKAAFLGKPVEDLASEVEFYYKAGYDFVPLQVGIRSIVEFRAGQHQVRTKSRLGMPSRTGESAYSVYSQGAQQRYWAEEGTGLIVSDREFEEFPWPTMQDLDLSILDDAARILPAGMKLIPVMGYIFLPAWRMMGFEHFCLSLSNNPGLVERLVNLFAALEYEIAKRAVEHPAVGAVWIGEDLAYSTSLLIAPRHFRRLLFPWYKRIGDLCKAHDLPLIQHSDGRLYEVLDDIIDCGFNAIHPIEPKAMDINYLKRTVGDRLCLIGNIDLGYTLTLGTPEDVENEVRQRITEVGVGGGYCVGSSNSVTEYVPIANYEAMRKAVFKHGRYPVACS